MRWLMMTGLLVGFCVAGCSGALSPYRIEMRQGNYITESMVKNIKTGMTKDQVRFFLGMPLLQDIFHQNRWDFLYQYSPGKLGRQQTSRQAVTILFDEEGLVTAVNISDKLPTDRPAISIVLTPDDKAAETAKTTETDKPSETDKKPEVNDMSATPDLPKAEGVEATPTAKVESQTEAVLKDNADTGTSEK
jgi:outer membrane protein assembly factor BamE